ncbi:hypothetical protein P9112_000484 [Eukaryota sp. TZLM1-RC]
MSSSTDSDQILDEATLHVKQLSAALRRYIDEQNFREIAKTASTMISELRTSLLSAQNYFSLYSVVIDELRWVEFYFDDEAKRGRSMNEFYVYVQRIGNIIPRLYLLVTVGSVFMKSGEAPVNHILKDLLEMCRGVQHPMRGLFLRSYLLQMSKDFLPNSNTTDPRHGDINDSIHFILSNFTEMNKLWVRMQHLPLDLPPLPKNQNELPPAELAKIKAGAKAKALEKRKHERLNLRVLVGHNLAVLANLEGLNHHLFGEEVLPVIFKQVINCKDPIAQQYVLESITHAFPDELHLRTIEQFLSTCADLHDSVDVNSIVSQYVSRVAEFASKNPGEVPKLYLEDNETEEDLFAVFAFYISKITTERKEVMGPSDIICLSDALLSVVLKCFPDRHDYIDHVISQLPSHASDSNNPEAFRSSSTISRQALALLKRVVEEYGNLSKIARLSHYHKAMALLPAMSARQLARVLGESCVGQNLLNLQDQSEEEITDTCQSVFNLLLPLYTDNDVDDEDRADDAILLGKVLCSFKGKVESSVQLSYVTTVHKLLEKSGDLRLRLIYPSLVDLALHAAFLGGKKEEKENNGEVEEAEKETEEGKHEQSEEEKVVENEVENGEENSRNAIKLALEYCEMLRDLDARLCLSLLTQVSLCAFKIAEFSLAYDSMAQALLVFEREPLGDSSKQLDAFMLIISSLKSMNLPDGLQDTLASRATNLHSQLLLRSDQCFALVLCSHLFENTDEDRVLEILRRSLKIADKCMETQVDVGLLVHILERFLYHFDRTCLEGSKIDATHINGILSLIASNLSEDPSGQAAFENVINHVNLKKEEEKFSEYYAEVSTSV